MSGIIDVDSHARGASAQEVQARFPNDATLQYTLTQLDFVAYGRSDLSLPENQSSLTQDALSDNAEHLSKSADGRQLRTIASSIAGTVAAFALAGATIVTGGAVGVAALGDAAIGAGTMAAASATGVVIEEGDNKGGVEQRDQREADDCLLLALRTQGKAQVQQVMGITRAADVHPVAQSEAALTPGTSSTSWTSA